VYFKLSGILNRPYISQPVYCMKKSFFVLILSASCLISQAQLSIITPKIGMTLSTGQNLTHFEYTPGFLVGASARYKLSEKFALISGVLHEQKSEKFGLPVVDSTGMIFPADEKLTYNYLCLPVSVEIRPLRNNHIFFNGGLYAGYLLNVQARIAQINNGENYYATHKIDIRHFTHLVLGLNIGGGINIPVSEHGEILLDLQYEYAITQGDEILELRFRTFSFSVGYGFKIGK
jgi:hypothetical protein